MASIHAEFFENNRSMIGRLLIIYSLGAVGVFLNISTGTLLLDLLVAIGIMVLATIIVAIILLLTTNKKTALIAITPETLSIRPTRRDEVVKLRWDEISKISLAAMKGKFHSNYLLIEPIDPKSLEDKVDKSIFKKMIKMHKLSGVPFNIGLGKIPKSELPRITALIETHMGEAIFKTPKLAGLNQFKGLK